MAFSNTSRMPAVEPEVARDLLLPLLPRRLRACLASRLRVTPARLALSEEIGALVPEAATHAAAWIEAAALAEGYAWNDTGFLAAGDALTRCLDAHAALHDRPAAQALADVVMLLSRSGDDRAAAVRLALPLWIDLDGLPDLALRLPALAAAQADLSLGRRDPCGDDEDLDAAARWTEAHAELCSAWTEALEAALVELRADACDAASAAAVIAAGGDDDFVGGTLLATAFSSFGQRLTWPVAERAGAKERAKRVRVEMLLRESEARLRKLTSAAKASAGTATAPSHVPAAVPAGQVLVVAGLQETGFDKGKSVARGYETVIGRPMPLASTPDLALVRAKLVFEFPYAVETLDRLLADLVGRPHAVLHPTVLVGPPGAGKSRLVGRLAYHLGIGLWRVDGTRDSGASIGGLDRRWSSAEPCHPVMAVNRYSIANPIILVDEIEKAATRTDYGQLWNALLPMLEPESARTYPDPAFQVEVDISHVSWVATANGLDPLPAPLRDRLREIEMQAPGPDHLDALLGPVLAGIAEARGLDPRLLPALDGVERDAVRARWPGGSVRRLTRLVEAIVAAREAREPRH